jgi:hypothetical protein
MSAMDVRRCYREKNGKRHALSSSPELVEVDIHGVGWNAVVSLAVVGWDWRLFVNWVFVCTSKPLRATQLTSSGASEMSGAIWPGCEGRYQDLYGIQGRRSQGTGEADVKEAIWFR